MTDTKTDVKQPHAATSEAPATFRRMSLAAALVIVALELGIFWVASRLIPASVVEGTTHKDLIAVFIVFWTMLTLQAMGAVGLGWMLVALGRTRLTVDRDRIEVEHPWRSWRGSGADVAELYTSRGWLHLRPRRSLRTWHVRGADARADVLDALRAVVPADAQLSAQAARRLMLSRTLGPWLIVIALGVLLLTVIQRWPAMRP